MNFLGLNRWKTKSVLASSLVFSLLLMPLSSVILKPVQAQTNPQSTPSISAGFYDSFAAKYDGTVWSWGYNNIGQLGDNTKKTKSIPVSTLIQDIKSISAGKQHTIALKNDGSVWSWGTNAYGQLGDSTTVARISPVKVQGLSDVVAITTGELHSVALKNDGTVWTWGSNANGALGDGTTVNKKVPVQVKNLTDIMAITAGTKFTLALKKDGTVWAWGNNAYGQLGDGTKSSKTTPVQVQGLTDISQIDTGAFHSLAIKNDGTLWSWGRNSYGQLGDATKTTRLIPVQVQGLANVVSIAGGYYHSLAVKSDGSVYSWGSNSYGQVGDGSKVLRTAPVKVQGLTGATSVAAGYYHSLALKDDGSVWSWGRNYYGNLGNGTNVNALIPVLVKGLALNGPNPIIDPEEVIYDPEEGSTSPDEEEPETEPQDEVAPVTSSNVFSGSFNQDVSISLSTTDDDSGVSQTFYSINDSSDVEGSSFVINKEGLNTVTFYSVDVAGNVESRQSLHIFIDHTAPITISNTASGLYNKDVSVELVAVDSGVGVDKTYYTINGSTPYVGQSFTLSEEGDYVVSFYSVDKLGNVEESHTLTIQIDKTAPVTTIDVLDNWFNSDVTVKLFAIDSFSGVDKTFYSINGSDLTSGTSAVVNEEGINHVSFFSVDKIGNEEAINNKEVKIDKTAPVTVSTINENYSKDDVSIALIAQDPLSGVAKTYYSINGSAFTEGSSFTVSEEGVNQVSFYSVDIAGNIEAVVTKEVKIDTTAPVTTSNSSDSWSKQDVTVQFTASDALSGAVKTFYSINGSAFAEGTSVVIDKEGETQIQFYSVDVAGNIESVQSVVVKVDKNAPVASWTFDKEEYAIGTNLKSTYLANDNGSGIASEVLTVNGKVIKNGDVIDLGTSGVTAFKLVVTDGAGHETIITKSILVYLEGTMKVEPGVIKGNKGVFTVKVTTPKGYTSEFIESGVSLNGVGTVDYNKNKNARFQNIISLVADILDKAKLKEKEKTDILSFLSSLLSNISSNKSMTQMFKFERSDFVWKEGTVDLEFRGVLSTGEVVIAKSNVQVKK